MRMRATAGAEAKATHGMRQLTKPKFGYNERFSAALNGGQYMYIHMYVCVCCIPYIYMHKSRLLVPHC